MAFFKDATGITSSRAITRMHKLIWALIFGGLLTLVLGVAVKRADSTTGWCLVAAGALLASAGAMLIYARSKMKTEP